MTEETKGAGILEEPVVRLLEQQSRYGMDQETMLLYISSVNLMSILSLIGRRFGGGSTISLPVPGSAAMPALGQTGAQGNSPSLDSIISMLVKMLGSQGGGAPGGQGINPAVLMNLLGALGGQNLDLGSLTSMLAGLMGSGTKPAQPAQKTESGAVKQSPASVGSAAAGSVKKVEPAAAKSAGANDGQKRETPKIMKWDQLEERKKA